MLFNLPGCEVKGTQSYEMISISYDISVSHQKNISLFII